MTGNLVAKHHLVFWTGQYLGSRSNALEDRGFDAWPVVRPWAGLGIAALGISWVDQFLADQTPSDADA